MRSQILLILLLPALLGQAPASADGDPKAEAIAKARRERLREIYLGDAASYVIHRDADRKEKVELRREPVYVWTNPVQAGGQDGHVFVWTCRGRAEVVGTIFSRPQAGPRGVVHELHSLSLATLDVDRPCGPTAWKPLAPGIEPRPLAGAPAPARSTAQRLTQMRALGREFAASAVNYQANRWELRLLPQPLYRYESTDPEVLDGAVFAFVTSAGTDPELILVLEARKGPGQPEPSWQFAAARFSNMGLTLKFREAVLFEAPLIKRNAPERDPLHRYHAKADRTIPPVEEMDAPTTEAPETGRKP